MASSQHVYPQHPCPRCGRTLIASGEMAVEGRPYPVYQCDECLVKVGLFGVPVDIAYTFMVDGDGHVFDAG